MRFKLSLLAGAALAVVGFSGSAQALSFTQTATFGPGLTEYNGTGPGNVNILLFDTNGGTLNSITFSDSYGFNSKITVTNGATTASSGNAQTESAAQFQAGTAAATAALNSVINTGGAVIIGASSLNPTAYDSLGNKSIYSLAPGASTTVTSISNTASNGPFIDTVSADLSAFSKAGGGNLALLFNTLTGTNLSNTGGNTSATQSTTSTGTVTLTYNYTAAPTPPPVPAPEPASMLILGTGLAGLGLVRRFRRG